MIRNGRQCYDIYRGKSMDEQKRVFCKNYGQCSKADSMEVFSAEGEAPFICPECRHELILQTSKKEKVKKYSILISIFLVVAVLPWLVVSQLFTSGRSVSPPLPIKPSDLKKYFIGSVHLSNDKTKTAVMKIYKIEESPTQITYYYTMNLNVTEARIDSLGLIIQKDKRIFVPDVGLLSYERTDDNRIILKSVDQMKKPYWSFEEAKQ